MTKRTKSGRPNRSRRPPDIDTETWFWQGFARVENGCLEWQWGKHKKGYGACSKEVGSGSIKAHRESWILTYGPIPEGLFVLHKCDNPPCGEPTHLFLGTIRDNTADMYSKGRGRALTGEAHPAAKLTWDSVNDIRSRFDAGESQVSLARFFGISQVRVHKIVRNQQWIS